MIWDDRYGRKCTKHAALEVFDVHPGIKKTVCDNSISHFQHLLVTVGRLTSLVEDIEGDCGP